MKSFISLLQEKFSWGMVKIFFIVVAFIISRAYIYSFPPASYSDVTADYERYANMWKYGLTPYLEHLYEYPPATIPLLSIPLELDLMGFGTYYPNYRAQILIIDVIFFFFLLKTFLRLDWRKKIGLHGLLWYILLTTFGKNFFYEGIDLAFTASIFVAITSMIFFKKDTWISRTIIWTLFWLSTALKFLTLPFMVPLWLITRTGNKKDFFVPLLGFLLVWGIPLGLYRSSLQVSFVFNNARPIKYASFPAHIIKWINLYTQSEQQRMVAPDFEYVGPVSDVVTKINKIVFPLALLLFLLWTGHETLISKYADEKKKNTEKKSVSHIRKYPLKALLFVKSLIFKESLKPKKISPSTQVFLLLKMYGVYVFLLFITAKIFSQPFHIWYMPFVVLFPFLPKKLKYVAISSMFLMVLLDMTELLHTKVDSEFIKQLRSSLRFIPMFIMVWIFSKQRLSDLEKKTK